MFYPPAIREDAAPSSEVRDAPEGIEVASPSVATKTIPPPPKCPLKGVILLGWRGPMRVRILMRPRRLQGL